MNKKIAFITGAGSGIGKATAKKLATEGCHVILSDINNDAGEAVTQSIIENGGAADYYPLDVADREKIIATIKKINEDHGGIDLAVNNAGIGGKGARLHEVQIADWRQMMDINISGVFHCLQEEIKLMLHQGKGSIVNVSSVAGLKGVPHASPYVAAKHAVVGLTKSAAREYAKANIRVNAVCPGFVETAILKGVPEKSLDFSLNYQVPMKRLGRPEEIAEAISWLLGGASSFVTGHTLYLEGGLMA